MRPELLHLQPVLLSRAGQLQLLDSIPGETETPIRQCRLPWQSSTGAGKSSVLDLSFPTVVQASYLVLSLDVGAQNRTLVHGKIAGVETTSHPFSGIAPISPGKAHAP